jgi:CRP-like cAMP-binding protein
VFARLAAAGTLVVAEAGSVIVREGDRGESLFLIKSGEVSVRKRSLDRERFELARVGAGGVFGEVAVMTDRRRHATVEARTRVELLEVGRREVAKVAQLQPEVAQILQNLVRERVASMLLSISPLFLAMPSDRRVAELAQFAAQRLPAGAMLTDVGDTLNQLVVVVLGTLELTARLPDGSRPRVMSLHEGDVFGEERLCGQPLSSLRATAVGPVELVAMPIDAAKGLFERSAEAAQYLRLEHARRVALLSGVMRSARR